MSTTSLEVEIQQYQGQQNEMRMMIVDIESTIARGHNDHYAGTLKVFKAQLREAEDRLANAPAGAATTVVGGNPARRGNKKTNGDLYWHSFFFVALTG